MYDKPRLVVGGTDTSNVRRFDQALIINDEIVNT